MIDTGEVEFRVRRERIKEVLLGRRDTAVHLGRFELRELLGAGGMGSVYSAYDPELDRTVAIKILDEDLPADRLRQEARMLAQLAHPNVVPVHEIGWQEGRAFVVMERVDGESLAQWLHRERRPWRSVLRAFVAAGHGLAAAHALGIVHRDFKPDNVLVDAAGHVRVVDFGLARPLEASTSHARGLPWPSHAGTPQFMAPEIRGGHSATATSDQYSFGFAAHDALFGADARVDGRPPRRVRRALARSMSGQPERRWPSLDELLAELDRDLTSSRRPWPWLVAAAAVATGVVIVGRRDAEIDPCVAGAEAIHDAWPGTTRARVAAHEPEGDVPSIAAGLDAYAERWSTTFASVCRAHSGAQAEVCLQSRLRTFSGVAEGLATDQLPPARWLQAVLSLPTVEDCAVETTAPTRSIDLQVELDLAEATAAGIVGIPSETIDDFEAATERARRSGHRLSLAHALLEHGTLRMFLGQGDIAEGLFDEAFWIALEDGYYAEASRASAWLAFVFAVRRREHERGALWGQLAETTSRHPGVPASVRANAIIKRAMAIQHAGQLTQAVEMYDRALEVFDRVPNPSPLLVAEFADRRSSALTAVGRADEALPQLVDAVAFARTAFGAKHTNVGHLLSGYGDVLAEVDRHGEAIDAYEEALGIYVEQHNPAGEADARTSLAAELHAVGRDDEALPMAREGLRLQQRWRGADSPGAGWSHAVLAEVQLGLGQPELALDDLRVALSIYETRMGAQHQEVLDVLELLVPAHARLGHVAEARAALERAEIIAATLPEPRRGRVSSRLAALRGEIGEEP